MAQFKGRVIVCHGFLGTGNARRNTGDIFVLVSFTGALTGVELGMTVSVTGVDLKIMLS